MVAMKGLFGKKRNPLEPVLPTMAAPQPEMPMSAGYEQMPVNDPKAGLGTRLFGQGWENKAFALGGLMRGDPTGAYMMRQDQRAEQQARAEAAAAQREAAMDWAKFQREHDYKVANPMPANNDTVNDVNWWMDATPEQRAAWREMNPVYQRGPDGQYYPVNRAAPAGDAPDTLPADFDFGGGGAGNSAGPFPR